MAESPILPGNTQSGLSRCVGEYPLRDGTNRVRMEPMAQGGDLFAMGEAAPMNLGFELVIRGYDRRQVGAYVEQAEAEITALAAERDEALRQAQTLATE